MSQSTEYNQKTANVSEITLTNFAGKTISLFPHFLGIDIQEDIFVPVVSGNITLIDTTNLYENFPIIGEETISITYSDFYSKPITRKFSVYGIGPREKTTERGSVYILNFCSEELLHNRINSYSKSYKDALVHDIVADAMSRVKSDKEINIQPTQELQDFISPGLCPFEVCSQMANRAISTEGHNGTYVFFEDNTKFNFVSIEKLINKAPILYRIGNAKIIGAKDTKFIFRNYVFINAANNINGMMSGAQSVKVKSLDLMNRKITNESYNHFGDDYEKIDRINSNNPDLKTTSNDYKYKSDKGLTKLTITSGENKSTKTKNMAKRYNSLSTYMNGPKIHGEVPFNSSLTIGDIVDVSIPKMDAQKRSDIPEYDKYIQGKYLVTALRQLIGPAEGETIIELSKDTYSQSHSDNYKQEQENVN